MAKVQTPIDKKIANLVTRRDYSKQDVNFEEPDLLKLQRDSYAEFLEDKENGLIGLIANEFPVKHTKNNKHEVQFFGARFYDGLYTEEEAREIGKSYEKPLYVDLRLFDHDTGEYKTAKKSKTDKHDGVFFGNIPMMTKNGTFIINGIEKFVISQTVRSPGAYVLTNAELKLNKKKKKTEGYVVQLHPNKGTMMNFWIDDKRKDKPLLKIIARNANGESYATLSATQLLKALGLTQAQIADIFGATNEVIAQTLSADAKSKSFGPKFEGIYHHDTIVNCPAIIDIRKDVIKVKADQLKQNPDVKPEFKPEEQKGLPIDRKLRSLVWEWDDLENDLTALLAKLQEKPTLELKQKVEKKKAEIREACDKIITEKAAQDIINALAISKRTTENLSITYPDFSYQDFLIRNLMTRKSFDLASAGRTKLGHKFRVTERLYQKVLAQDLTANGKVIIKKGKLIGKEEIDLIKKYVSAGELDIVKTYPIFNNSTFTKDKANKIAKSMTLEIIDVYADNQMWNEGIVRVIGISPKANSLSLLLDDIIAMISYTTNLPHNIGNYDDIEHLGNKRLKLIAEQFAGKLTTGMAKVKKHITDKLASLYTKTMNEESIAEKRKTTTIKGVVNTKPFQQVIKSFFNQYQLTQFIDQQNPLSELTNKRRISAMGDGGIRREDPNLNIRDVHYSHYGRICPIETPEGMNIGLIMSLASYAEVDKDGFIKSPYFVVKNGVITDEIKKLNAFEEDEYIIGEASTPRDENGKITEKKVVGRYRGMQELYDAKEINFIDVSPKQVVSIAASAVPFLENDDTARALMGSNMQRQAVPLLKPYAPIVGTGAEYKIAHDSGLNILAANDGTVTEIDGKHIVVETKDGSKDKYKLVKYRETNQSTCNNQLPIVELGQKVKKGQVIADGPAMFNGELAIGRNPIIAYTTWHGYNFEDAIVISKRLIQDDWYTSISITEVSIKCTSTTNGDEEFTRDVPNVSDDVKKYLDDEGIILVGAEVKEGDILVGRVSPKGDADETPEEKLLATIFGKKNKGIKDSSLKVKTGQEGTVIAIKKFKSPQSVGGPDWITINFEDETLFEVKVFIAQKRKLQIGDKMSGRHGNKGTISRIVPVEDMPYLPDGTPVDILLSPLGVPSRMNIGQILEVHLGWAMRNLAKKKLWELIENGNAIADYVQLFGCSSIRAKLLKDECVDYFKKNKISKFSEFTNVDLTIILNKVGMSIEDLSYKASTPVFQGAKLDDISAALKEAGFDPVKTKGKTKLIDGQTGEYFDGEITVGIMYMLKLDHMVDDKIHARAVGPYSKVNQQPLGGRSQDGGQRFGEMEVWALEAYGASYNLREILTIKSDDTLGRNLAYKSIVNGKKLPEPSLPESFRLLTKQLQGLCLSMYVHDTDGQVYDMNEYSAAITEKENKIEQEDEEASVTTEETSSYSYGL